MNKENKNEAEQVKQNKKSRATPAVEPLRVILETLSFHFTMGNESRSIFVTFSEHVPSQFNSDHDRSVCLSRQTAPPH